MRLNSGTGTMDYSERAQRFRNQAEECRKLADRAHLDSSRQTYVNAARSFDLMATEMDALQRGG
jgi:hypothetical protein